MSLCQPNMCSFFFTSSPGSAYSPLAFFVASPGRLPTKSLRMIALVVVIAADIEKNPVPHQTLGQTNKPMYEPNKIHLFAGKLPCISWDLLRTRVYSTQKRTLPCTYFLRSRVYSTQKRTLPYSKFFEIESILNTKNIYDTAPWLLCFWLSQATVVQPVPLPPPHLWIFAIRSPATAPDQTAWWKHIL